MDTHFPALAFAVLALRLNVLWRTSDEARRYAVPSLSTACSTGVVPDVTVSMAADPLVAPTSTVFAAPATVFVTKCTDFCRWYALTEMERMAVADLPCSAPSEGELLHDAAARTRVAVDATDTGVTRRRRGHLSAPSLPESRDPGSCASWPVVAVTARSWWSWSSFLPECSLMSWS